MRHTRLSLEPLEERLNPVTYVLATFSQGALVITGNDNIESLEITQGADDRLTLTQFGGGEIRLNGGPPMAAVTLPAPVTAGVTVRLFGGADMLTLIPTVRCPSRAWAASSPPTRRALAQAMCRSSYGNRGGHLRLLAGLLDEA